MKNNWQTKKVGEIIKLEYGKPLPKNSREINGKYPVYGANGIKDWSNSFYVDYPSIIVGRKGSAGELKLTENKFWPLDVTYFVKFNNNKYDLKFIYNLLKTLNLPKMAKGVKPGINRNEVYSLSIQIPEAISEQKRIVKILDEVFEKIEKAKENTEKNLQNAKELFESYLQLLFEKKGKDWQEKLLGQLSERVSVGHVGPTTEFYCDPSVGVPFIRSQNVRSGYLDWNGMQYITKDFDNKLKKSQLKFGDILFVRVGANRGDCCILKENTKFNCANIVFARLKEGNVDFIDKFCQSRVGKRQLLGMSVGAAQGVINTKSVAELIIPYPPISDQRSMVKKIDNLSEQTKKLESIYQQKLTDLEELKKSILQKAFSGEL